MRSLFLNILPRLLLMKGCKKVEVEGDSESHGSETVDTVKIQPNTELGQIYAELKYISNRMKAEDRDGEHQEDWKFAAAVFDRFSTQMIFW